MKMTRVYFLRETVSWFVFQFSSASISCFILEVFFLWVILCFPSCSNLLSCFFSLIILLCIQFVSVHLCLFPCSVSAPCVHCALLVCTQFSFLFLLTFGCMLAFEPLYQHYLGTHCVSSASHPGVFASRPSLNCRICLTVMTLQIKFLYNHKQYFLYLQGN